MWKKPLLFLILLGVIIPDFCAEAIDPGVLQELLTDEIQISPSKLSFLPSNTEAGSDASYLFSFSLQSPLDSSQSYALLLTFRALNSSSAYAFLQNPPYALCWLLDSSIQTTRNILSSLYDDFSNRIPISCYSINQTQSLLIYLPQEVNGTEITIQIDKLLNPAR